MKKILSVVLVLIMVAGSLAACGYSTSPGLLRTFADALNKQDTEAMADCWYNADEGEMEIILNIFKLGYEVIYGKINKIELTSYKMTKEEIRRQQAQGLCRGIYRSLRGRRQNGQ